MSNVYCGPAPVPATLLTAWNPDLIAGALCLCLVVLFAVAGAPDRRAVMAAAIAIMAVLFFSPLCALTAALFSARAVHHVLLVTVVAPLLAAAFPARSLLARIGTPWVVAIHAVLFWLWHVPDVYGLAVTDAKAYWLMQASLLGSGTWFWHRVLASRGSVGAGLAALLTMTVQMGLLGAILTFAPQALYDVHDLTTLPFGLTPLQDQQLAGLIMWVPAALPYVAVALYLVWPMLDSSRADAR